VTRLAGGLFAALVLATFGAFFVAQALKTSPPVIQQLGVDPWLSPNRDGRKERARIAFRLKRADTVDLTIVDRAGDAVRELVQGRSLEAGEPLRVRWDGRDDDGRLVADGVYRARLVLRRQGRSVVLPRTIRLDTTPPSPRVLSIGPVANARPGPELLPTPSGEPATIRFFAPGRRPSVEIWRTDGPRPRRVTGLRIEAMRGAVGRATWDGTARGRRVPPGTYVAVVRSRDIAGNIGSSVPERILAGRARPGDRARGAGGITVRYLGVQPPVVPARAGGTFTVAVDARGETYNWSLRRVGEREPALRSRRSTGGALTRPVPGDESGLYLFEARTRTRRARVPVAVDDRRDNPVLVVLPATTWVGRNELDDDGDGIPDTLDRGLPVRLHRVFAGSGLPAGFARNEAPLLARIDRLPGRYDLTTDIALAAGQGPQIEGHRGVLLAGDHVWLTEDVRRRLRRFVAAGGTLASFGTGSLRATVRQTPRRLVDPSPPARTDLFGAVIEPVRHQPATLTILEDDDAVQLFAGGEGLFPDVGAWEATASVGREARLLSAAVTRAGARPVVVAVRFGRGVVIRTGIPDLPTRLARDPDSAALVERIWTLLRGR
jgi:hypothetical protein